MLIVNVFNTDTCHLPSTLKRLRPAKHWNTLEIKLEIKMYFSLQLSWTFKGSVRPFLLLFQISHYSKELHCTGNQQTVSPAEVFAKYKAIY